MILHTLSAAPGTTSFANCLRVAVDSDRILLLGDGVYGALAGSDSASALSAAGIDVFALAQDVAAAGIGDLIADFVAVVDFNRFVELTEACERQLNWD